MRTTLVALFSVTGAACAPIGGDMGNRQTGPDAGTTQAACNSQQTVSQDWNITSADGFGTPPTGCYNLDGTLTLSGSAITSLAKLGDIRGVKQLVLDNTALASIDSTSPIIVSDKLSITNNAKLTGLSNLQFESTDLLSSVTVEYNSALTDAGALARVTRVTGAVAIDNNAKLSTLDMSQLQRAEGGLAIHDNAALVTVKLDALQSVTGDFVVRNNTALTNVGSWAALQYIHGNLIIDTNQALTSLDTAFPMGMIEIGALTVNNNAQLTSVGQLAHLAYFDTTFAFTNNPNLSYCAIQPVGCCVPHTADTIAGNNGTSCNNGPHSWCYASNGNSCPYQY